MLRIIKHSHGPRLYVAGLRLHHGPAFAAIAVGLRHHRKLSLIAAGVALTDARDFPFRDCDNH